MAQTGYVITRAKNLKEYFTTSSAYDVPKWVELKEATEFPTAELAHHAAKKLWMKGNFSAKVVPVSEITIDDLRDLMGDGVTDRPPLDNTDSYNETDPLASDEADDALPDDETDVEDENGCEWVCPDDEDEDTPDDLEDDLEDEMDDRPDGDITMSLEMPPEEDDIMIKRGMRESTIMPKKPQLDAKPDDKKPGLIPNLKSGEDIKLKDPTVTDKKSSSDFSYAGSMEHDEKVKVPVDIRSSLNGVIATFRKCSDDSISSGDRASFCKTVAGALDALAKDLDMGTVGGIKQAQIHMTSYMSPITSHIPADVAKFIAMGGKKSSLKNLFDDKRAVVKDKS